MYDSATQTIPQIRDSVRDAINDPDHAATNVVSIAVTPATPSISHSAGTQQMVATATLSDGSTKVVTTQCLWSTSDGTKATVSVGGLVTGVGAGSVNIIAAYGGKSGLTAATIT
jgi:hypothetical protein